MPPSETFSAYVCGGRTWFVREGSTDVQVINETWLEDHYRLRGVRGAMIDIGANIGTFALRALHEGASHVYCYEPEPSNLQRLRYNCGSAIEAGLITLDPRAVWSETDVELAVLPDTGMTKVQPLSPDRPEFTVSTISLNDVLGQHDRIDYLKIDAEWSEVVIIQAVDLDQLHKVRFLGMEFHAVPADPEMVDKLSQIFKLEILDEIPNENGNMIFGVNRSALSW